MPAHDNRVWLRDRSKAASTQDRPHQLHVSAVVRNTRRAQRWLTASTRCAQNYALQEICKVSHTCWLRRVQCRGAHAQPAIYYLHFHYLKAHLITHYRSFRHHYYSRYRYYYHYYYQYYYNYHIKIYYNMKKALLSRHNKSQGEGGRETAAPEPASQPQPSQPRPSPQQPATA